MSDDLAQSHIVHDVRAMIDDIEGNVTERAANARRADLDERRGDHLKRLRRSAALLQREEALAILSEFLKRSLQGAAAGANSAFGGQSPW